MCPYDEDECPKVYVGDQLQGTGSLYTRDPLNPKARIAYTIPTGAIVKVYLPGVSPTAVVMSSASTPAEVTITGSNTISWASQPGTSNNLNPNVNPAALDVVVFDSSGNQLKTFEKLRVFKIKVRSNS